MAVISGGHIPDRFMDKEVYFRSFRVFAPGMKASQIYHGLTNFIDAAHISTIGKVDSNTFEVIVPDREAFYVLQEAGAIQVGGKLVKLSRTSEQAMEVKCHWLPDYVSDEFLTEWFGRFGHVEDVTRDTQFVSGETPMKMKNGVRTVRLILGELYKHYIPHLVKFDAGITMLITMRGREPLCLKCQEVGHIRRDCTTVRRSYAQATVERPRRQNGPPASPAAQSQRPTTDDDVVVPQARGTPTPASAATSDPAPSPIPTPAGGSGTPDPRQEDPVGGDSQPTPGQIPGDIDVDVDTGDGDRDSMFDFLMGTVSTEKRPHEDEDDHEEPMTHAITKKGRAVPIT